MIHYICPVCKGIADYKAYYGRYTCTRCAWEGDNTMTEIEEIKAEIAKLQEKVERLEAEAAQNDEWPKVGDAYYSISDTGQIERYLWDGCENDIDTASIGNMFRTEEDAEFAVERLKVLAEMRKFAFEPDWDDESQVKYFMRLRGGNIELNVIATLNFGIPVFESEERARACIEAIGEERLKKYWFGVKENVT